MFLKASSKTALVWKDKKYSYNEFFDKIALYSKYTSKSETKKVAVFSENRPEWAFAFYSAWFNSFINIPIDFMSTAEEVAYILKDSQPDVLFCSENTHEVLLNATKNLDYKFEIIVFEDIDETADFERINEFPEENPDDTALIIYTSGTTGSPKGVMLTYANMIANITAVSQQADLYTVDSNVMVLLPTHHVLPLLGSLVAPLYVGATCTYCPSLSSEDVLDTLGNNPITMIVGVPRFYSLIIKGIRKKIDASAVSRLFYKLAEKINSMSFSKKIFAKVHQKMGGHIKYLVCGGAAVDIDVERGWRTLGFELLVGFGMTEASPIISFPRPGEAVFKASGKALPGSELKIDDGEIAVKGPQVMRGYFNRPEETAQVLRDGWLYTGDLAHIDDDGNVFITGRRKEIIVTSAGKNINPAEIESKIMKASPIIEEIGVFQTEGVLKAVVFPNYAEATRMEIKDIEAAIKTLVNEEYNPKVSQYKRLRSITLINEELPKTRLGKIKRFELPTLGETISKKAHAAEQPIYEEYSIIRDFLHEEKNKDIYADDRLETDLAMDSLDMVSFSVFLNSTFGVDVSMDVLAEYPTVRKLADYIRERKVKIEVEAVKWSEIFKEKLDVKLPASWFTHNLIKNMSRLFFGLYFKVKGEGTEKLPDTPFIIAPNHQSLFDTLFVGMFLKNKVFKRTYVYAKKKHFDKKLRRIYANTHNVIIVDIQKDLKQSLQKMAEVLKSGKNIIIFPEGTRSFDGKIGDFKKTFAILSRELQVPVVPVAINGAYAALPRGSHIPRPFKKINVKFLDPIYPENLSYDNLKDKVFSAVSGALGK